KNIVNDLTEPIKDIQPKKIAKDIADAAKGKSKPAAKTTVKKSEDAAEIADASVDAVDTSTSDKHVSDDHDSDEPTTETGKRKSLPTPKKLSSTPTNSSATPKKSTLTATSKRPALGETMPEENKPADEPVNQPEEEQPKAVQMSKVTDTEPENTIMPPQPDAEAVTADAA
ncbi:MAG: hypothetical protein AAF639_34530, partial [Chloroflexota bacterium]